MPLTPSPLSGRAPCARILGLVQAVTVPCSPRSHRRDAAVQLIARMLSEGLRVVRRWTAGAAVVGLVALVMCGPAAADGTPYHDAHRAGDLTLCDANGHELRGGDLAADPLAALVLGSTPAPPGYDGPRATATLLAFQPRQGVDPGEWSGELIGAGSRFSNPRHPAVAGVPGDLTLQGFVGDFPPHWDGLVQLRVYLGAPGRSPYSERYDTADLRVQGNRWSLVRGGGEACDAGRATSVSTILGVASRPAGSPSRASGLAPKPSSRSTAPAAGSVAGAADVDQAVAHHRSSNPVLPIAGGLLVALMLAGGYVLLRRPTGADAT